MGAICPDCGQDMLKADSCTHRHIEIEGKVMERDTTCFNPNRRCGDCGILPLPGHPHHIGCDLEMCPACRGQLLTCDCRKGPTSM